MLTKHILQIAICAAFTLLASIVCASQSAGQKVPFACNMGALTKAQRADISTAIHKLIAAKPTARELPDGYEMTFEHAGELFPIAMTWIQNERLCCPFFRFSVSLEQNNGPMVVRLMGDPGVKEFIDADLPGLKTLTQSKS